MTSITIRAGDDMHAHVRDGDVLAAVVPLSFAGIRRALIMPNLRPPVRTAADAMAYRERILARMPAGKVLDPLMSLYLTDQTTAEDIRAAKESGVVVACKLYPAGATTNSDSGVTDLGKVMPALREMALQGILLLVHGEVTDPDVDIFEREAVFVQTVLPKLLAVDGLKIVLEHITTKDAAEFVQQDTSGLLAATVTAHHLLYNRNALFAGGIRPHYYCLPILKHDEHRRALVKAVTSGHPRIFMGTDSAPHIRSTKEASCGCAGIFTGHAALELYAEVFEAANALDKFERFASVNGAEFYGLPLNEDTVTLVKEPWQVPEQYPVPGLKDGIVPLRAGSSVRWAVKGAGQKK